MHKMDKHAAKEQKQSDTPDKERDGTPQIEANLVAPGISIIRSNTPRPLSFVTASSTGELVQARLTGQEAQAVFPVQAPVAPPLPEESEAQSEVAQTEVIIAAQPGAEEKSDAPEFAWLFEYGLEMEPSNLNNRERLDGQAYRYGPAVVKGFQLHGIELPGGQVVPTLVKSQSSTQEVWGVLYRIPHRLLERTGQAHSRLDLAHSVPVFAPASVTVQEAYRKREVQCITYIAMSNASQAFVVFPAEQRRLDSVYAQQLLVCAKQQELPATYLAELAAFASTRDDQDLLDDEARLHQAQHAEQDTEPIPTLVPGTVGSNEALATPAIIEPRHAASFGWLLTLAFYLVFLLVTTLSLAVLQALGYWAEVFMPSFAPLGVPWYVLIYGLLGGCTGGMMALGRRSSLSYPLFAILTWFARPFVGTILAALAYLLLNSGLFALSMVPEQRYALFAIVGALAGMSERWLFLRRG